MTLLDRHPENAQELSAFLEQNAKGECEPVIPVGGGTWLDFGRPVSAGVKLQTGKLADVRDYPARDMTITVQAGLPVERLAEVLAEERQQIPVDFPQGDRATVGGVIAANVSGPRRFGFGTLRDYLIGVTAVDAHGKIFQAGGRVVKNVAGYDLCKLLIGSWGTLAVITEVTLKVVPIPETQSWVWSTWDSPENLDGALESLLTSKARPIAIEVLNDTAAETVLKSCRLDQPRARYALALLVTGSPADTDWQCRTLTEELRSHQPNDVELVPNPAAGDLLRALTDFPLPSSRLSFQANLLPSRTMEFLERARNLGCRLQAHAGNGVVIGQVPDDLDTVEQAREILAPLRKLAESHRGRLVLQNGPEEWKPEIGVFGSTDPGWRLMKDLKKSLDPQNLLSPGRLFDAD